LKKGYRIYKPYATTLALASRPRQRVCKVVGQEEAMSEGKCERMNPHTHKGASTLGV